MSLGLTRDSIADLQKLYNTSVSDEDFFTTAPRSAGGAVVSQETNDDVDDFLFFDEEAEGGEAGPGANNFLIGTNSHVVQEQVIFGNDYDEDDHVNKPRQISSSTQSTVATVPSSNSNDDIFISSPIKQNNNHNNTTKITTNQKTNIFTIIPTTTTISTKNIKSSPSSYYSGYDYSTYAAEYNFDDYIDPYALSNNHHLDLHYQNKNKNIFCCLLPNSSSKNSNKDEENENDRGGNPEEDDLVSEESAMDVSHHNLISDSIDDVQNQEYKIQQDSDEESLGASHHGFADIEYSDDDDDDDDDMLVQSKSIVNTKKLHKHSSFEEDDLESDDSLGASHHGLGDIRGSYDVDTDDDDDYLENENETDIEESGLGASHHGLADIDSDLDTDSDDDDLSYDGDVKETPSQLTEPFQPALESNQLSQQQQQRQQQQQPEQKEAEVVEAMGVEVRNLPSTSTLKTANSPTKSPQPQQEEMMKKPIKGILKRTITKPDHQQQTNNKATNTNLKKDEPGRRRNILPTYEISRSFDDSSKFMNNMIRNGTNTSSHGESPDKHPPKERKTVSFSPMARVINVASRNEMSLFSRSLIWWQRNDYDDFKKTGRIIAQAMLCGGSEIWLQTSNAWGKKLGSQSPTKNNTNSRNNNAKDQQHLNALKKYGVTVSSDDEDSDEDVGSKWWCKFGHSRRGLEHIVSIDEGRQRQRFVNTAIRAVLDEQRRQRMTRKDPVKIAAVSMQYTSWARDLATASGAADAEAVQSNFDSKAKCRIQHLRRGLIKSGRTANNNIAKSSFQDAHIPCASFVLAANTVLTAKVLDANTHSTLKMKQMKKNESATVEEEKKTSSGEENDIAKKAAGFQF